MAGQRNARMQQRDIKTKKPDREQVYGSFHKYA
jgi:hypothetical protein